MIFYFDLRISELCYNIPFFKQKDVVHVTSKINNEREHILLKIV